MDKPDSSSTTSQQESNPLPSSPPKQSPEEIARKVLESRSVRLFRPSETRFDPRRIQLPDDFFEPSTAELRAVSQSMTDAAQRAADAPMMTKKMRDAETAKRMSRFRKVMIRILFPDRVALQGIFEPASTIRQVQRFVRAALRDARNVRFHMFVVPPKTKLVDLNATLWSQGFAPAALVHIAIEDGPQESSILLKDWLLERIEDTPESVAPDPVALPLSTAKEERSELAKPEKKSGGRKLPKWFRK